MKQSFFDLLKYAGTGIADDISDFDKAKALAMIGNGGGSTPSGRKIRITDWVQERYNRLSFTPIDYDGFKQIEVTMEGTDSLQYNFIGYDSGGNMIVDKFWYNSGEMLELPEMSGVVKWNLWLKFVGGESISPSDVTSCICTLYD